MNKILKIIGFAMLMSVCFCLLWAQERFRTLDKISIDGNTITIALSGKAKCHAFKISNPARVVIEFTNTEFNAKDREITGSGDIKRIRGGQYQNDPIKVARVVVDLVKMSEYELKTSGKLVKLVLNSQTPEDNTAKSAEEGVNVSSQTAAAAAVPAEPETKQAAPAAMQVPVKPQPAAPQAKSAQDETPIVIAQPVTPEESKKVDILPVPVAPAPQVKAAVKPAPAANTQLTVSANDTNTQQNKTTPPQNDQTVGNKQIYLSKKPITIDFEDADIRDVFRMLSMKVA